MSYQAHLVSPRLAKMQTMARPNFPDMPPNRTKKVRSGIITVYDSILCNNQINARALIGQSAMGYCASKPTEKSRVV